MQSSIRPELGGVGLYFFLGQSEIGGTLGARRSSRTAWTRTLCKDIEARNLPIQAIYRKLGYVQKSALGTGIYVIRKHT